VSEDQARALGAREVAADFVELLKAIVDEDEIRLYSVRFDADLYDIEVTHDAWGIVSAPPGRLRD